MNYGLLAESAVLYCQSESPGMAEDDRLTTAAPKCIGSTNGLWEHVQVEISEIQKRKYSKAMLTLCHPTPYIRNTGDKGKRKQLQRSYKT